VDLLNTIFFLSSFIDIAVNVDGLNCRDWASYCDDYGYCVVVNALLNWCQETQACSGLAALSFVLWLVSSIWVIRFIFVNRAPTGPNVNEMRRNDEGMKEMSNPEGNTMPDAAPRHRMMEDPDV